MLNYFGSLTQLHLSGQVQQLCATQLLGKDPLSIFNEGTEQ